MIKQVVQLSCKAGKLMQIVPQATLSVCVSVLFRFCKKEKHQTWNILLKISLKTWEEEGMVFLHECKLRVSKQIRVYG